MRGREGAERGRHGSRDAGGAHQGIVDPGRFDQPGAVREPPRERRTDLREAYNPGSAKSLTVQGAVCDPKKTAQQLLRSTFRFVDNGPARRPACG
ncbi:hypothetical protein GCM10027614_25210 [Micromonospora vulcania]